MLIGGFTRQSRSELRLELDGQAGDDAKYSVQLENCGKVEKLTGILSETAEVGG